MHERVPGHETPTSSSKVVDRFGVSCTVQALPFHRSAEASVTPVAEEFPTAVHARAVAHESAETTPAGSGAGSRRQLLPFQRSAHDACIRLGSVRLPTAMHVRAVGHETASSELETVSAGTGAENRPGAPVPPFDQGGRHARRWIAGGVTDGETEL